MPGHGPVGGKADLKEMRDYLALLLREGATQLTTPASAPGAPPRSWIWASTRPGPTRIAWPPTWRGSTPSCKGTIGPDMDRDLARQAVVEYNQLKRRP